SGTATLNGPLPPGLPGSGPASQAKTADSKPSPRIVPVHVFTLVACMADPRSGQHTPDDIALTQARRPAERIGQLRFGGDAEAMVDGRDQILRGDRALDGVGGPAVGAAMDDARLDAGTGEDDGVASAPVTAPALAFDERGAAELAHPDDEGLV